MRATRIHRKPRQRGMPCVPRAPGTCGRNRRRLCLGMPGPWDNSQATPRGNHARVFAGNFTADVAACHPRSCPLGSTGQAASWWPWQRRLMVFVQCTEMRSPHVQHKGPPKKTVITGTVLVTKCPCVHPGDVRKFTAVDVPELHHVIDCIVFPAHGPRPHPEEMAGEPSFHDC
ncbi:hypothetical protein MRX96_021184 [Rhipicephalus microplus]